MWWRQDASHPDPSRTPNLVHQAAKPLTLAARAQYSIIIAVSAARKSRSSSSDCLWQPADRTPSSVPYISSVILAHQTRGQRWDKGSIRIALLASDRYFLHLCKCVQVSSHPSRPRKLSEENLISGRFAKLYTPDTRPRRPETGYDRDGQVPPVPQRWLRGFDREGKRYPYSPLHAYRG